MPCIATTNSCLAITTSTDFHLFRGTTYLRLDMNLALIGFAYLLSRDVALGFWFFFLLSSLQRGCL